jgi:single-strand DNA-binding protein
MHESRDLHRNIRKVLWNYADTRNILNLEDVQKSLHRVMMIGNLGQDPEIRYTPSGLPLVNFSVATDESYLDKEGKRQERVEWHRIVVIGKLALTCNEYLKKGRQVFVEGRLRTREIEAKTDGRKQRRTEITATRVQFLGSPPELKTDAADDNEPAPIDLDIPFSSREVPEYVYNVSLCAAGTSFISMLSHE